MINYKALLAATILATSPYAAFAANIKPATNEEKVTQESKSAAVSFVEYLNYSRLALANKNYAVAHDSLIAAKEVLVKLKTAPQADKVSKVQSNKVNYEADNNNYHYFPIETGPVPIKKVKTGPFWASEKGVAVTDAEVVNVVLDLNNEKLESHLDEAINDVKNKNYTAAQLHLTRVSDIIVKDDTVTRTPLVKARDNLSLADSFIEHKNFDGARFALKHANNALDEASRDKAYADRKVRIAEMHAEIDELEAKIKKNDPGALEKASSRIKSWWKELKD